MNWVMMKEVSREDLGFVALLKACAMKKDACKGIEIHDELVQRGLLHKSLRVSSSMINMYAKCELLEKALEVLEGLPIRNVVTWNALISGYAQAGQRSREALDCFECMLIEGIVPNSVAFASVLKACGNLGAIIEGGYLHNEIARLGLLEKDGMVILGSSLVNMYVKCGVLKKAESVLQELPARTLASWNALISEYARQGQDHKALTCFERMQWEDERMVPDMVTYIFVLKACGSLGDIEKGIQIHDEIVDKGLLLEDARLGSALIGMYAKCGMLVKSQQVLDDLPIRNEVSWSLLIAGYANQNRGSEALKCFQMMKYEGCFVDTIIFICVVKACGTVRTMDEGKGIHSEAVSRGLLEKSIVLGTAFVDMYAKCGLFTEAQYVLEALPVRNEVSWSALIEGYAQHGRDHEALSCLKQMEAEGISPNTITYISILKACGNTRAIDEGMEIHREIVSKRQGLLEKDIVLGTALVNMYAKCGMLSNARLVLQGLPIRNVICWNALITGYAKHGHGHEALDSFEKMQSEGLCPDAVTFLPITKACGWLGALDKGKHIHCKIVSRGFLENDVMLCNALVDMYAKCGMFAQAEQLLEVCPISDVVTWNALIEGYAEYGQYDRVLDCSKRMESEGLVPDAITLLYILKACGAVGATNKGEGIHGMIKDMIVVDQKGTVALANALMGMYAECGMLGRAKEVLERLAFQDVVAWNAFITTSVQHGQGNEALDSFEQMQSMGIPPDVVTYLCTLKACGSIGAVDKGKQIHHDISSKGFVEKDIMLGTALVDMYVKCGCLVKAQRVLEGLPLRNVATWNALISGYVLQEQPGIDDMLGNIECMQIDGIVPNKVTFACVLNAFSRLGLLGEAERLFERLIGKYGILPDVNHYASMVLACGKAGLFDKATSIVKMMPCSDYPVIRLALLYACSKWGCSEMWRSTFDRAIQLRDS